MNKYLRNLTFDNILSNKTHYGLIWRGKYKSQECIIKMVILSSGIHYDKITDKYYNGNHNRHPDNKHSDNKHPDNKNPDNKHLDIKQNNEPTEDAKPIEDKSMDRSQALQYFSHDDQMFRHTEFINRKAMTKKMFMREVNELDKLHKLHIAPKLYEYHICDDLFDTHYGLLVMELVDCSLKDILLKRNLQHNEEIVITDMIKKMHNVHNIVHGDLKPSNIGVYLNRHDHIYKCCLFDCQKIKHKDKFPISFHRMVQRDLTNFKKHLDKNTSNITSNLQNI